jgi:hypothetical protein
MSKKIIAFGCWSNEMPIVENGQCGVIHGRLFSTEALARKYYKPYNSPPDDPIVRVTVELIPAETEVKP